MSNAIACSTRLAIGAKPVSTATNRIGPAEVSSRVKSPYVNRAAPLDVRENVLAERIRGRPAEMETQVHSIAGTTGDSKKAARSSVSQLEMDILTREETQRLGARCANVQHHQIVLQMLELGHPRLKLLMIDIVGRARLLGLDDQVAGRSDDARQHVTGCGLGLGKHEIRGFNRLDGSGKHPHPASTAAAVRAVVAKIETGPQAGIQQGFVGFYVELVSTRTDGDIKSHALIFRTAAWRCRFSGISGRHPAACFARRPVCPVVPRRSVPHLHLVQQPA
jgi:hypothetical protein